MGFLVDNPQILVTRVATEVRRWEIDAKLSLDAVFVPFRDRHENVKGLLDELHWYDGPIYLLPSDESDNKFIGRYQDGRVNSLQIDNAELTYFFENSYTSHHKYCTRNVHWDLPTKRNLALISARKKGYRKVLFVDDDIRGLTPHALRTGSDLLEEYIISGCFVQDHLDTSILGHLERIAGDQVMGFLSGSFLFLRPFETQGFFPNIYNEDWLFMLPHIQQHSICSFGTINQLYNNPFKNPDEAMFQEFGEIIAEGLFALVQAGKYERRYEPRVWADTISERRAIFNLLKGHPKCRDQSAFIDSAMRANKCITSEDCISFIHGWEKDIQQWQSLIQE
jgi:hypothetical protein